MDGIARTLPALLPVDRCGSEWFWREATPKPT
jgi:hypothetical protein